MLAVICNFEPSDGAGVDYAAVRFPSPVTANDAYQQWKASGSAYAASIGKTEPTPLPMNALKPLFSQASVARAIALPLGALKDPGSSFAPPRPYARTSPAAGVSVR